MTELKQNKVSYTGGRRLREGEKEETGAEGQGLRYYNTRASKRTETVTHVLQASFFSPQPCVWWCVSSTLLGTLVTILLWSRHADQDVKGGAAPAEANRRNTHRAWWFNYAFVPLYAILLTCVQSATIYQTPILQKGQGLTFFCKGSFRLLLS